MKVMIADDHSMIRGILRRGLKDLGIDDVVMATNGREALQLLPDSGVELVFLDWHMPEMDGLATLKTIRKTPALARLAVIMVTSEAHGDNIKAAIQAGVDQYLIKPFDNAKLHEKVQHIMHHHPTFRSKPQEEKREQRGVDFAQSFIDATVHILGTMAALPITPQAVITEHRPCRVDITSVIGMSGPTSGAAMLSFPQPLATQVIQAFMDDESEPTQECVEDGVEEILNMVVGKARAALAHTSYVFEMSLPTIVRGHGHELPLPKEPCKVWVVPFVVYDQQFLLELRLAT